MRNGNKIFFNLIGSLFIVTGLLAQVTDVPITSLGDLRFYIDHAGFRGENGRTYQEFYLMLYADQLKEILKNEQQITVSP